MKKIPVEVFSRVVGYFRPLINWNKGKIEEFKERHAQSRKEVEDALKKK